MTIKELEKFANEKYENVLQDFFDSCIRNGYYNMSQNAKYFVDENNLEKSEYYQVLQDLKKLDGEEEKGDVFYVHL